MASVEVVVTPPVFWDDGQVEELAAALEEVADRFPGTAVEVRLASPSLSAQVDQLQAQVRDSQRDQDDIRARMDETEATAKRLEATRSPVGAFVIGFVAGVWAALFGAWLAGQVGL